MILGRELRCAHRQGHMEALNRVCIINALITLLIKSGENSVKIKFKNVTTFEISNAYRLGKNVILNLGCRLWDPLRLSYMG